MSTAGKILFRVLVGAFVTLLLAGVIVAVVLAIQGKDITGRNALNLIDQGVDDVRDQLYPQDTPPDNI